PTMKSPTLNISKAHCKISRGLSGRAPWPYCPVADLTPPGKMPDGEPWPKISIVTPSFNQGQFLEETILSVIHQNYPNLEYIIIDGGSTDETIEVLQRHSEKLTFWVSEKDRGQSHAINKGFALATGQIVGWLNSDDMLAPGALAAVALAFHNSSANMVAGICQLYENGLVKEKHLTSCQNGQLPLEELLDVNNCWLKGQFFFQPEVFFKRELWLEAGGRVEENLFFSMDYELWVRFAEVGATIKVIGRPVAFYRIHAQQKTFQAEDYKPELERVAREFRDKHNLPKKDKLPGAEKSNLKIVLFNDNGFRYGAGIAHQRLARALSLAGHEVFPIAIADNNFNQPERLNLLEKLALHEIEKVNPDVVILGNLHGANLEPTFLEAIASKWPTIFFLHDLWLLTGRCAYHGDCAKYLTGCDALCPTAHEYPKLAPAKIHPAWTAKRNILSKLNKLFLAGDSQWTMQKLQEVFSTGGECEAHCGLVYYGLPLEIFKVRDKVSCRESLALPQDKFILLFSCSNLADSRKGTEHLVQAMKLLNLADVVTVCVGYNEGSNKLDLPNLVYFEYTTDPVRKAMLFSAADLFVGPSLEEAFGQVFIEAAACGTPSIGYAVGGVPEALGQGICGQVVNKVAPESLAEAIESSYSNPARRKEIAFWGRVYVENEFSFARSYHRLARLMRTALQEQKISLIPKISFRVDSPELRPVLYIHDLIEPPIWPRTPAVPSLDLIQSPVSHTNGEAAPMEPSMYRHRPSETESLLKVNAELGVTSPERLRFLFHPENSPAMFPLQAFQLAHNRVKDALENCREIRSFIEFKFLCRAIIEAGECLQKEHAALLHTATQLNELGPFSDFIAQGLSGSIEKFRDFSRLVVETQRCREYQEQLDSYRKKKVHWIFYPVAWETRFQRGRQRKKIEELKSRIKDQTFLKIAENLPEK
ncbi:MAG: glycosyltransferase, partial [Limisphaerales bacterium]